MSDRTRSSLASLAVMTVVSCGIACGPAYAAAPPIIFPEYFSKDPARPMRLLAQKWFGTNDAYSEEVLPFDPRATQPFGDAGHLLARVRLPEDSLQPLTLRLDAAAVDARQGESVRAAELVLGLAIVCHSPSEVCQNAPAPALERVTVQVAPRVKFSLNPWSYDGSTYTRVTVEGVERTLMKGQGGRSLNVPVAPWEEADLLIAFPRRTASPGSLQVIQLRASLLQGEFTETEPSPRSRMRAWLRPLAIGDWTIAVAGIAMLYMGFVAWRAVRAGRSDDAPRAFGALLFLLGGVLSAAPMALHGLQRDTQGTLYYTATGLLFALSGVHAFFDRPAAKFWYTAGYLLAVGWTFMEFDTFSREFVMRLGMPTLIGAYVWHLARTGRFQFSREPLVSS